MQNSRAERQCFDESVDDESFKTGGEAIVLHRCDCLKNLRQQNASRSTGVQNADARAAHESNGLCVCFVYADAVSIFGHGSLRSLLADGLGHKTAILEHDALASIDFW